VADLKTAVGAAKIAAVLTGSKAQWIQPMGADQLSAYGCVQGSQGTVREVVDELLEEGLLRLGGNRMYPVVLLSEPGRRELETDDEFQESDPASAWLDAPDRVPVAADVETSPPQTEWFGTDEEPVPETDPEPSWRPDPDSQLRRLLDRLLCAERDEAKAILPDLKLFHPRAVAERLAGRADSARSPRERARAIWAAGELCGADGLAFLLQCCSSDDPTDRRLAAAALGKVVAAVLEADHETSGQLDSARAYLRQLCDDPIVQVGQYAREALGKFPTDS